jgi:hypothetical protein
MPSVTSGALSAVRFANQPPPPRGNQRPHSLHQPKRPRALKKSIGGAHQTGERESKDEPRAPILEGITNKHCSHCKQTKHRKWGHNSSYRRSILKLTRPQGETINGSFRDFDLNAAGSGLENYNVLYGEGMFPQIKVLLCSIKELSYRGSHFQNGIASA